MKIDSTGKVAAGYASQTKPAARGNEAAPQAAVRSETVAINPQAGQLSSAEPSFDASKVDAIKQAMARGEFQVNPEAIADGLIASVQELVGR